MITRIQRQLVFGCQLITIECRFQLKRLKMLPAFLKRRVQPSPFTNQDLINHQTFKRLRKITSTVDFESGAGNSFN